MILTDYFCSEKDITWEYAVQCGVRHGVIRLPETQDFDLADASCWRSLCGRFRKNGITPLVIEPLPNQLHDHIKSGDELRDQSIETFCKMLPLMREQGIGTVCFNFMAKIGWTRTRSDIRERGGAKVTGFRMADFVPGPEAIETEVLWENYRYFLKAVLPEAERWGIRLALHPDDPPITTLGNVHRIMVSLDHIQKAMEVVPSPMLGVTFCQATYHMMGEDVEQAARLLADKIFFIHFRNCRGTPWDFWETFHDNGELDMARLIALYAELGLDVPVRVDHVPQLAGETEGTAGYTALGRLYAIGYLKGLLEMYDCLSQK
jgi:mannonate dehydratase